MEQDIPQSFFKHITRVISAVTTPTIYLKALIQRFDFTNNW